jgi:hypothetical protein
VTNVPRGGRKWHGHNRVAVDDICGKMTQGSAWGATLGFETESRWDSHIAAFRERFGHGMLRANLDLPDLF